MIEKRFTWLKKDVYAPQIVITDSLTEKDLTPIDCYKLLNNLSEENEQLKNKIDVLEDDNETYYKSLEKLNLYTKRFIPTKCTNEFKDCKTNRYYWLDHEGNFKGVLELLNLLDCENEQLKQQIGELEFKLRTIEAYDRTVKEEHSYTVDDFKKKLEKW